MSVGQDCIKKLDMSREYSSVVEGFTLGEASKRAARTPFHGAFLKRLALVGTYSESDG